MSLLFDFFIENNLDQPFYDFYYWLKSFESIGFYHPEYFWGIIGLWLFVVKRIHRSIIWN